MHDSTPEISLIILHDGQPEPLDRYLDEVGQNNCRDFLVDVLVVGQSGLVQVPTAELQNIRGEVVAECIPLNSDSYRLELLEALERASGPFVTVMCTSDTSEIPDLALVAQHLAKNTIVTAPDSPGGTHREADATWASTLSNKFVDREYLRNIIEFETESLTDDPHTIQTMWAALLAIYTPHLVRLDHSPASEPDPPDSALVYNSPRADEVSPAQVPVLDPNYSSTESLDFLQRLEELRQYAPQTARGDLDLIAASELRMVNAWLRDNPSRQAEVAEEIESWARVGYPYDELNRGLGKTLVISYAFSPDMDTAGLVVARRIRVWQQVVNVMSNDLSATNKYDPESFQLCAPFVERHIKLYARPTISGWHRISSFVKKGLNYIDQNPEWFSQHDHIYSRVMLPPSHFLAAVIKLRNPDLKWTAEFSDPLSRGIRNSVRHPRLRATDDDPIYVELRSHLEKAGLLEIAGDNVYLWDELLAYSLADELVFANSRHHQYMIEHVPDDDLREHVEQISQAIPHPPPPARFYDIATSPITLDPSKINIGYLGAFYDTRRLVELTDALEHLSAEERDQLAITFIGKNPLLVLEKNGVNTKKLNISVQPPVTYFEALAMQKDFDYLIVNDASTKEYFDYNIYLPSKISDMAAGHVKVWGITEPGSLLDGKAVDVKSQIGDVGGAVAALRQILAEADDEN